jgi:hypothetical protein
LVLEGRNPYDAKALYAVEGASKYAFFYPPTFLLAVLPFGILPYDVALVAWVALGIAVYAALARRISPSVWPVLAFPPLLINAAHGQNGAVTAAVFMAAALTMARMPFVAGAALGAFVIKPHLALLFPIALLCGKQWRAIAGGVLSASLGIGASWLLLPGSLWSQYIAVGGDAGGLLADPLLLPKMVSAYGMLRAPGAPLWAAIFAQVAASVAAALCVARAWRSADTGFAMAVLATGAVLATPFIYSYDLVILIVPLAWLANDGMRRGFAPLTKAIMVIVYGMPLYDRTIALLAGFNPAALADLALLGALFRQHRWKVAMDKETGTAPSGPAVPPLG